VIDPNDPETLQDLVLSAVNEGIRQGQQRMQTALTQQFGNFGNIAANLNLPGFPKA
jgi:DNA-binding protein YbaB